MKIIITFCFILILFPLHNCQNISLFASDEQKEKVSYRLNLSYNGNSLKLDSNVVINGLVYRGIDIFQIDSTIDMYIHLEESDTLNLNYSDLEHVVKSQYSSMYNKLPCILQMSIYDSNALLIKELTNQLLVKYDFMDSFKTQKYLVRIVNECEDTRVSYRTFKY